MTIKREIEASMTEVILGIVKAPAYATTIKDFCAAKNGRYPPTQNGDIRSLF